MPAKKDWEKSLPRAPKYSSVIRSIILQHIRWREPRPMPVIHQYVIDDYGQITDRSIYRHLKALIQAGEIKKVQDDSEDTVGYVRAKKPRWSKSEQVYI